MSASNSTTPITRSSGRQRTKTWKIREQNEFIPIVVHPLPKIAKPILDHPIPHFEPESRILFDSMRPTTPCTDPISVFLHLLGEQTLAALVESTNEYANYYTQKPTLPRSRPWYNLTRNELIVFIGTLFYMGRHPEHNIEYYWRPEMHHLGQYMLKNRWEQIHRFLTMNTQERQPDQPWFYKLEPAVTTIRSNIASAVSPASWLAVDEMMVAFRGRSKHTVKVKNKPIDQGFKIWALGFNGYIYTFRFHSGCEGSEGMNKPRQFEQHELPPIQLAPQFQVPIVLCQQVRTLHPEQQYLVFLDNLFLNIHIAHCLLAIGFAVMGTTRKNAAGIPDALLEVKNTEKKSRKQLVWNSVMAVIVSFCLCFLWQDNNAVIAITTAHSLHRQEDQVEVLRRRPKATSSNAAITWPVFEGQSTKWLRIPSAINDYNHGMNGVDTASQLRTGFSCHKPHEVKWWRPLFYWLLDICANNSYLLWRTTQPITHKLHQQFIDTLIHSLLHYDKWTPIPTNIHRPIRLERKRRCAYGVKRPGACLQGDSKRDTNRRFGTEISGNVRPSRRPRQVRTTCRECGVTLCIDRICWQAFHATATS